MKQTLAILLAFVGCTNGGLNDSQGAVGAAERVIRVGTEDGDAAYVFSSIGGVGVTAEGTIVAADLATGQVRFFSPEGAWLSTTGRRGSGPKEFGSPWVVGCSSHEVIVFDPRLGRITTLTSGGDVIRSVRTEVQGRAIGTLNDSTFWVVHDELNVADARYRFTYVLVNSHTGIGRTVHEVVVEGGSIRQDGKNTITTPPRRSTHPVAAACGGRLFLLTEDANHVDAVTQDGARTSTGIPAPLRGEDVVPLIAATGTADLWIAAPAQGGLRKWTEYRGSEVYSWLLPETFRPAGLIAGRVLGIERDSMDVEYVAVYVLQGRE